MLTSKRIRCSLCCVSQVDATSEQVATFLSDKARDAGSIQTVSFYKMSVERIFLPWMQEQGITDARNFTVMQWNAYVDELRSRDLAIQSVLTYLRGARIFLRSLEVPIQKFKMPKAPKPMLEILTREEIDRLEDTADNERDKLIIRVLANTGIRLSELTGLKMKDLREVTSPTRYYRLRVWGKGSKEREVPVDKDTYKRIEKFGGMGGKRTYVFPAMQHDTKAGALVMLDGPRLTNNTVDKMFRELRAKAGIAKPCTPHKLRHAFATYSLQNGMAIEKLQQILGHADLNMIIKVYSHMVPDDASREYERVFNRRPVVEQEEPKKRRRIA